MNILTMEKISKNYGDKPLLSEVSFGMEEGDRVGIIGINGTGKSTLLKIIAGLEEPDTGNIITARNKTIEYLAQNPVFREDATVMEHIMIGHRPDDWNLMASAKSMLNRMGFDRYEDVISTLSGGQRKRAELVRTLLNPADILVLDEPTNHLDQEMSEWLEEYLEGYYGSFIMVTHDRYFLDEVVNRIVEIDGGQLYTYEANYSNYLAIKAEREEQAAASERKKKSLYRIDLEWMSRGARARSTKQKAHMERFISLRDREKPAETKSVEMQSVSKRMGKQTVEIRNLCKSYGERVLIQDFSYIFLKQDRIGVVGKNGAGKTTLLKILQGIVLPDSGEVTIGQTITIGYFAQENQVLNENERVIDSIRNIAEYIDTEEGKITASAMLERFLFIGSVQYTPVSKLSGGEKRRLYLLRVLMQAPNVLILDEPTNDLDIKTLSILEEYLDHFSGIVITVSHDRYFLDRVVNRIFAFSENGRIRQYEGGFTDYQIRKNEEQENVHIEKKDIFEKDVKSISKEANIETWKKKEEKFKFTYKEKQEYETIDERIADLENKIQKVSADIEHFATDYSKLNELLTEKETLSEALLEAEDRWIYLNDLAERMGVMKD